MIPLETLKNVSVDPDRRLIKCGKDPAIRVAPQEWLAFKGIVAGCKTSTELALFMSAMEQMALEENGYPTGHCLRPFVDWDAENRARSALSRLRNALGKNHHIVPHLRHIQQGRVR